MKHIRKYALNLFNSLDLFFLFIFTTYIHLLSIERNYPASDTSSIKISIFIFGIVGIFTVFIGLKARQHILPTYKILKIFDSDAFQNFLIRFSLATGFIILISIFYSLSQFSEIAKSGGFGLRAISTSLHPLVPLETRWIYLLGPWVYCLDVKGRKNKILWFINLLIWFVLIYLSQTKINFLFLMAFSALLLIKSILKKPSVIQILFYLSVIIASYRSMNYLIFNTEFGEQITLNNPKVKEAAKANLWEKTPYAPMCKSFTVTSASIPTQKIKIREHGAFSEVINRLEYRIFGTTTKVTNVFFCLRDKGNWNPQFRGHQLMRLVGLFKPVNRWAMVYFDPDHGATAATSAVANFITDAYFNGGFIGVAIATFFSIAGWFFLLFLSNSESRNKSYLFYLRYIFVFILLSQSFLSALIIILFLIIIYNLFILYSKYLFKIAN